ncbi:MAG: 2-oxo acid dehydrogenase subunit E2 [Candidatus Binatia bacterium]|nr:2-oxo acid dehydrogenase subunit E2 [Candidatus Binatia bacterium]
MSGETQLAPTTPVRMPKIGQAMAAGTVLQWHYRDGDSVAQGTILVTIETDKATYDLEAPASGTLHIYVAEGQEVAVGTVIAEIGEPSHPHSRVPISTPPAAPLPGTGPPRTSRQQKILASPKAKQLAAQHGIELSTISPSSPDGIISADDVVRAIAAKTAGQPASPGGGITAPRGRTLRERRQLTGLRKTAARRLQEAWQTIPHIVQMVDVDATRLLAARAALKHTVPSVTLNDLILHAAALVLAGLPELNATIEGDTLALYEGVDVGFAVDTPRGLVVPVIRRADTLSLAELVTESQRLIAAARASRLAAADIGGASLTVSNLGMFGIRCGTPVINLGEPILVFVGAVEDRPVAVAGKVEIRPMLTLSVAYDHRVADGVAASQFTRGLKDRLESLDLTGQQVESFSGAAVSPTHAQPHATSSQEEGEQRTVRAVSEGNGYAVQLSSSRHAWVLDEPAAGGGTDVGPDPVTAFLGALLGCLTISFKAAARRRGIALERVSGHVRATPSGHVKRIALTLEAWSAEEEARVRTLLEPAHRACYVSGILRPDIALTVELRVHPV